jgi:hypothetical protein
MIIPEQTCSQHYAINNEWHNSLPWQQKHFHSKDATIKGAVRSDVSSAVHLMLHKEGTSDSYLVTSS